MRIVATNVWVLDVLILKIADEIFGSESFFMCARRFAFYLFF